MGAFAVVLIFAMMFGARSKKQYQQTKTEELSSDRMGMLNLDHTSPDDAPWHHRFQTTPLLFDDFTTAETSVLHTGQTETTSYTFVNGMYCMQVAIPNYVAWSSVQQSSYVTATHIAIQVETYTAASASNVASGMLFRYQNDANYYLFAVSHKGLYSLTLVQDGKWIALMDWTSSRAINTGNQASPQMVSNTLRVELAGEYITLFVNGVRLETMRDATFRNGEVALAVNTFTFEEEKEIVVFFDNLAIFQSGESD